MPFLKEVGFINAVQVPSNDGEDLLCYVLTNKCLAALVSNCRVRPGVKIMDIRDRSMPTEHMTTYEKCCVFRHMTGDRNKQCGRWFTFKKLRIELVNLARCVYDVYQ